MRITGGQWRGRVIQSPEDTSIRPTSDKVRQAVFNTLTSRMGPCAGMRILDICCGSGVLACEALSRGAGHALAIDANPASLTLAQKNAALLGSTLETLRTDVRSLPSRPAQTAPFDLAFVDPPYGHGLALPILQGLLNGKWLNYTAWVVIETESTTTLTPPAAFQIATQKKYGRTALWFLSHKGV